MRPWLKRYRKEAKPLAVPSWRKWLAVGATAALVAFVALQRTEAAHLLRLLGRTDWRWLPAPVLCEALFQTNEATIYWLMYRVMGHRTCLPRVIRLTLAAAFVNRIAPSAGVSGTALFTERMARVGVPPSATVTVNLARYVLDYGAFALILGCGMIYLSLHHELTPVEIRAAATLGALILALLVVAAVLVSQRSALAAVVTAVARALNRGAARLGVGKAVSVDAAASGVEEALQAIAVLAHSGRSTAALVCMGFFIHLFDLAGLWSVFMAVGHPVHLGVLVAGYGLAYLAGFVSLVPSGLGVFEASMAVVYASLGVPLAQAVLVTLLYRLFSLWMPVLAGYTALQITLREGRPDAQAL